MSRGATLLWPAPGFLPESKHDDVSLSLAGLRLAEASNVTGTEHPERVGGQRRVALDQGPCVLSHPHGVWRLTGRDGGDDGLERAGAGRVRGDRGDECTLAHSTSDTGGPAEDGGAAGEGVAVTAGTGRLVASDGGVKSRRTVPIGVSVTSTSCPR